MKARIQVLWLNLLVLAVACDEKTPQAGSTPAGWHVADETLRAAAGPNYQDEDFAFQAGTPEHCATQAPMKPADGFVRLSIPIKLEGRSNREVPASAMAFTLSDADGHTYRPTLAGCHASIKTKLLTAGTTLEAHAAFDVPETQTKWVLSFHPFLIGRKEVRAQVEVPAVPEPELPQ